MKVPRKQVYLGDLLELSFENEVEDFNINFRGENYGVSCNASGKAIFLLEWKGPEIEVNKGQFKKECGLFKRWTNGYGVTMAKRSQVSSDPKHLIGFATSIVYRSDKFGPTHNYRHKYKPGKCRVYASSLGDNPAIFAIKHITGKVIVTGAGLVG